jgi:hypothetical protein
MANTTRCRTVLITGSTDGVGRAVAKAMGDRDFRVLVHGRDQKRGAAVVAEIVAAGGAAEFIAADLASLGEVRRLVTAVPEKTERLDILINNAGIGTAGAERQMSADGYELRFAVNYLAGFLLTRLLLPLLTRSAPARIVNVSSGGQQAIDFDDQRLQRHAGLLPEQARTDSFHVRPRRGIGWHGGKCDLPSSGNLYGHHDGPPSRRETLEQRRGRGRSHHEPRVIAGPRRTERGLFQWPEPGKAKCPGLQPRCSLSAAGPKPRTDRPRASQMTARS